MGMASGFRLGPYEILTLLGSGGMGEVYRARDTKLNRDVALKVLPSEFALDADRLARFKREAQVLASLEHPNIGAIYGFEDSDGAHALVLQLIEGPTLADRIAQGAMPLDDALPVARQIAEALEAAHEKGVIHRDLKPANVKVTPDGTVKVLDFGLAKLLEVEGAASGETRAYSPAMTHSPTITTPAMTQLGVILGTAAYMSPEQAKGRPADKRSDIWAFGCLLYEMLTGKRAFDGEDVSDTLASVLRGDPDLTKLPASTAHSIRPLLQRCLTKDARGRLQAIGEARIAIERTIADNDRAEDADTRSVSRTRVGRRELLPWAVAALAVAVAVAVAVLLVLASTQSAGSVEKVKLSVELGADTALVQTGGAAAILSPDGHTLVFLGQKSGTRTQLYIRRLDQLEAVPLSGTEGAVSPFFSPDGQWVAFFADGKLKKISITGGAALTLCDATAGRGGFWDDAGQITLSPQNFTTLVRVSEAGGTPTKVTALGENEVTHRWPQVLPGGRAVLYTAQSSGVGYGDANSFVQPLPAGAPKLVQRGAYHARYIASGHLVFVRDGTLFAAPFDLDRLEVSGPVAPVLEGVATNRFGSAQFDVSRNGTLVYLPGQASRDEVPILWMGRDGKTTPLKAAPVDWSNILFAPDGRRLAVDISDGKQTDVWVYEWARDTLSRITFIGDAQKPVWTPDGRRIAFVSTRGATGALNLFWQRSDGTGEVERLTDSQFSQGVWSFHPSGKFLAYHENNMQTRDDILILPIEGDEASGWKPGKPTIFLKTPFAERAPMFSPDGRWLAYQSTETGRDEVYIRPFPAGGGKWQISTGGGILPTWSRTRHELFYATPDQRIMVVPYTVEGDSFRAEKPRLWADGRFFPRARTGPNRSFDLHPDGDRIALAPVTDTPTTVKQDKVVFIFNFLDELRRIAPVKK
jgi:Tol biopolymer transport system component